MGTLLWLPIINNAVLGFMPNVPLTGLSGIWNVILGLDQTQASTVPISLTNPNDAPLCTEAIENADVPAADLAYYASQLAAFTSAGIFTQDQATQIAATLGITQ